MGARQPRRLERHAGIRRRRGTTARRPAAVDGPLGHCSRGSTRRGSARSSRVRRTRSCSRGATPAFAAGELVLNSPRFRHAAGALAEARPRHAGSRGRRSGGSSTRVRVRFADGRRGLVANLHATGSHDKRLPDAEVRRAAWFADAVTAPDEVCVLAGDFNVRPPMSRTLPDLCGPEWGFSQPGPGIDHVLVRGAEATPGRPWPLRRRQSRPSALRPCTRRADRPRDLRGGPRAVPGARAPRLPERRDVGPLARATVEAIVAQHQRGPRRGPRLDDAASRRSSGARARVARGDRRRCRHARRARRAHDLDDERLPHRPRRPRARPRRRDRHDRRGALRPARAARRVTAARTGRAVRDRPAGGRARALLAEVGPSTRLIALSHILVGHGHVLPIAELSREPASPILVDGAQSGGAIEVDATPYDFYTVSGAEVAVRAGLDRRACSCASRSRSQVSPPTYLSQVSFEPDGDVRAAAGRRPLRPRLDAGPRSLAGLQAALDGAPEWRFERAPRDGRALPRPARRALRRRHRAGPLDARRLPPTAIPDDGRAARSRPASSSATCRGTGLVRASVG